MRVLILRPEPGNAATVRAIAEMNLTPVALPLFEIVPVAWDPPDPADYDAVMMTSANAARQAGAGLAKFVRLPLHAVGNATAVTARAAGFSHIHVGDGDAAALAHTLCGRVLHLAGSDHVAVDTRSTITRIVVYTARARAVAALPEADVALVHSPRAGTALAALAGGARSMTIVAISAAAAQACGSGWAEVIVADAPREAQMLESLAKLCEARAA